jgi:hypothetical protein
VRPDGSVFVIFPQPAIPALALLELFNSFQQLNAAEVRPQSLRHVDLCVGELPQKKIA